MKYAVSLSKATKFIVDDNFAANKMRTKEILMGMIAEKIKTRWVVLPLFLLNLRLSVLNIGITDRNIRIDGGLFKGLVIPYL